MFPGRARELFTGECTRPNKIGGQERQIGRRRRQRKDEQREDTKETAVPRKSLRFLGYKLSI